MEALNHINNLGRKATDKVTGITGVISSVSFDLYGCIQYLVTPQAKEGREQGESYWLDVVRLDVHDYRVMDTPNYDQGYVAEGNKGFADKPVK